MILETTVEEAAIVSGINNTQAHYRKYLAIIYVGIHWIQRSKKHESTSSTTLSSKRFQVVPFCGVIFKAGTTKGLS